MKSQLKDIIEKGANTIETCNKSKDTGLNHNNKHLGSNDNVIFTIISNVSSFYSFRMFLVFLVFDFYMSRVLNTCPIAHVCLLL